MEFSITSVVDRTVRISGDVVSDGDIVVEGNVTGSIQGHSVTVAERARVRGRIRCNTLLIRGTLEGDVLARRVRLAGTAQVGGTIAHDSLTVEPGANLRVELSRLPY